MAWNRAAATVQLIMLTSSHRESIFILDCLALCKIACTTGLQKACHTVLWKSSGASWVLREQLYSSASSRLWKWSPTVSL